MTTKHIVVEGSRSLLDSVRSNLLLYINPVSSEYSQRYSQDFQLLYSDLRESNQYKSQLEMVLQGSEGDLDIVKRHLAELKVKLNRLADADLAMYEFKVGWRSCKEHLVKTYLNTTSMLFPDVRVEAVSYEIEFFDLTRYRVSCFGPTERVVQLRERTRGPGALLHAGNDTITFYPAQKAPALELQVSESAEYEEIPSLVR